jgi:glutathione S-transferase
MMMPQLYYSLLSGHSYKVRLLLSFLGVDYEPALLDLARGDNKTPEYLAINPLGQVPVWVDGNVTVRDSQAILVYLAQSHSDSTWRLPSDPLELSRIIQWLSVAANEITHGPTAVRNYWRKQPSTIDIELATKRTHAILTIINDHLATREWLELDRPTIADIACFPYISLVHEGKVSLDDYPNVADWVGRFKKLKGYIELVQG